MASKSKSRPKSMDELKTRYEKLGRELTTHAYVQFAKGLSTAKEAKKHGEDFQTIAAKQDSDNDFMSTIGNLEDRYKIDAAGIAYLIIKKIKPDAVEKIQNPWDVDGDSEHEKVRNALSAAENIENKYENQFSKSMQLLTNSFNEGCEEVKQQVSEGKELRDPITGDVIGGDTFKKAFTDFSAEKLDKLGNGILGLKTDILTIGPQLAVKFLQSVFHKDGNIHRVLKLGKKGFDAIKKKKGENEKDEFDRNIGKNKKYDQAAEIIIDTFKNTVLNKGENNNEQK